MTDIFFITALALPPTAEKYLVDIQRAVLAGRGYPSALALPPVLPLSASPVSPSPEELKNIRRRRRSPFTLTGYGERKGFLFAAARTGDPSALLPGFYLADSGLRRRPMPSPADLPDLPSGMVRALRLAVFEIRLACGGNPWWRGVEWTVRSEDWIRLVP